MMIDLPAEVIDDIEDTFGPEGLFEFEAQINNAVNLAYGFEHVIVQYITNNASVFYVPIAHISMSVH